MTAELAKPKRRRGAPDGNSNALRHGFYSRQFKKVVQRDLDGHQFEGLTDEITLLRVLIRQIFEDVIHSQNVEARLEGFRAISLGCFSLSRLVRTQHIIAPEGSDLDAALQEAIAMVKDELCADPPEPLPLPGWQKNSLEGTQTDENN